ncbi:MAG: homoserine dehydrogenase [Erysipelotrichaceae bacterium]|nr:homoserine dehydrogenase [Erysipelotrichaceae bacterium]
MAEHCIKAALLGLGTVGGGVYKVIKNQEEEMEAKLGAKVEIKKILVRNLEKAAGKIDNPSLLTNSWKEIVEDPEIQIVIEVMGGIEPAKTYILEALKAGKHVVTANKDLIAAEGKVLMDTAGETKRDFLHEAAVAGGIPILRPLKQCLAGNHISEVMGIVNGTTNFILTKMSDEGMEFKDALKLAQDLGYAESDPTADVEGLDAARKVAILASTAFNSRVTFDDVYTEGITKISSRDIHYAKEMGWTIKLLGVARNTSEGIEARVHPMLIDSSHPLASVKDSYNAVFVQGDAVQDAMFYGRGAGELPTASAVVGDVFDVVRNILHNCCGKIGCTCYKELPIKKMEDIRSKYFIRMQVEDRNGVLANIASVFGNNGVSLAQVIQKRKRGELAEIVVITDSVRECHFMDSLAIFGGMSTVKEISTVIRVA